jgi:hypothetical protein
VPVGRCRFSRSLLEFIMENTSHSTNPFRRLFQIDVSKHVEKKGLFSYLSWPFAVAQLRLADPDASWEVRRFDGLPYGCNPSPARSSPRRLRLAYFYFATFLKWLKYRLLSYISNALPHKEYDDEIAKFIYLGSGVRWPAAARI